MELPGTVAASKPPEAARNCLRSIVGIAADDSLREWLSDGFLGHESWGRDVMRFTSANAAWNQTNVCSAALYDGGTGKQAWKNRFSRESLLGRSKDRIDEN